jgi:hypothetical protein
MESGLSRQRGVDRSLSLEPFEGRAFRDHASPDPNRVADKSLHTATRPRDPRGHSDEETGTNFISSPPAVRESHR